MYTVFGYNDCCKNFEIKFDSFVSAVVAFRKLRWGCVVFLMRENQQRVYISINYSFPS